MERQMLLPLPVDGLERPFWREPHRPWWMTDQEADIVAERTRMALSEAGWPVDWMVDPDPRCHVYARREGERVPREVFDRARRMAMESIGAVVIEEA